MSEQLKASAVTDPNMGDVVQWEHPKIWGGIGIVTQTGQKSCNISKTVRDRTKVTIMD